MKREKRIMPFYTKVNNILRNSNVFVKPSNSQTLKEAKNIWVKNTNGVLKPIWSYRWNTTSWGSCSVSCGGGWQYRTVTCVRNDNVTKADIFCSGMTKPAQSQACNTHSCYWASQIQFHYGRHNTGDTKQYIGDMMSSGTLHFSIYVSDTCRTGTAWLALEKISKATGTRTEVWRSGDLIRGVCSDWREEFIGTFDVAINEASRLEFRGYITGRNNCCASIIVKNIRK